MKDLISVVVSIYNVEKYLRKCIETIINQTYNNIEIILVNDGSTDNSLKICDEYKVKDARISIINKKNGGLSDARNTGLKSAKGKYICFIDADDYINEKYIEELYKLIIENNAQIAVCNFEKVDENEKCIFKNDITTNQFSGKEALEYLNGDNFSVVAWDKLYDINLFKNIKYPVGKIHEDEFTTYKLYYIAEKIAITSKVLYYYRQVETSIMNRKFNIKRLDALEAFEEKTKFFLEKKEKKLYKLALIEYEKNMIDYSIKSKLYINDSKKIRNDIQKKYRKNYVKVIWFRECSIRRKLIFTMAYISPMLCYHLKKIKNRLSLKYTEMK